MPPKDKYAERREVTEYFDKLHETQYYIVTVGSFGVVLDEGFNSKTGEGLKLVKGRATKLEEFALAMDIAASTEGHLQLIKESFSRTATTASSTPWK